MPYANLPDDPETIARMDSCVEKVMAEGKDKESAIAICHSTISGKSEKNAMQSLVDSILAKFKAGARHNTGDKKAGQSIHDASVDLDASCPMSLFKQAEGSYRWVLFSSTAYKDRDGEIVSTKAQEDDCEYMDKTGDYGVLRWWHMGSPYAKVKGDWRSWVAGKGIDLGACDFSAMHGRVRVESGTFYNDDVGARFKEIADQLSVSIGFAHPDDEPNAGGIFENTHTFERSLLPAGMQSNHFVSVPLIEKESQMDDKKENKLKELLGGMAELVLGKAEATDKAAEESGVAFKAIGEWSEADLKAFVKKCMDETMKAHMPEPDADDKAKAAKEAQVKDAQTTKALDAIQTSLKELQGNDEKIAAAIGMLGKMQTANAESIKALQGDLPKSLASLKRSTASDNIIDEKVVEAHVPSLKQDGGFGDFMQFAVTGSANGGKPPAG